MTPRRYALSSYDLDGLLATLFAFMHHDEAEMTLPLPLDVDARPGVDHGFERWPVASAAELRWLLGEGFELFLHVTATLRGQNDDQPSACGASTRWEVDEWRPPGVTSIAAYHDQYGLLVRLDGDAVVIGPGWRGRETGIVPLAACAASIAAELTELVESFVSATGERR